MRVIFVRHGETQHNIDKISQGHFDSRLTQNGCIQAGIAAKQLKAEHIALAYTSDLSRAYETCRAIMAFHPLAAIHEDKRLREQSKGIYENGPSSVFRNAHKKGKIPYPEWKPEKGESLLETQKKIIAFWNDLLLQHSDETILIVSHGLTMSVLYAYLLNKEITNFKDYIPSNTACSIVNVDNNITSFEVLNNKKL